MNKEELEMKIRCAIGDILEEYDGNNDDTYNVEISVFKWVEDGSDGSTGVLETLVEFEDNYIPYHEEDDENENSQKN